MCKISQNMMAYEHYKRARDMSWKVLLECKINRLPVDLSIIAKYYDIKIQSYSNTTLIQTLTAEVAHGDGFISRIDGNKIIFVNDKINNRNRRRFTVAHELGHGILGHDINTIHCHNSETDDKDDFEEYEANVFARDILIVACVLKELNVKTGNEIIKYCDVSRQSAEIRLARLKELYKRDLFYLSPLEKQIKNNFKDFIDENRK